MGLIGHPEKITDLKSSSDGKNLFSSGGSDYTINIWDIDFNSLEQTFFKGIILIFPIYKNIIAADETEGESINTYIDFLEGGSTGQTYNDLKGFFSYAEIKSKGEDSSKVIS